LQAVGTEALTRSLCLELGISHGETTGSCHPCELCPQTYGSAREPGDRDKQVTDTALWVPSGRGEGLQIWGRKSWVGVLAS
jgi:hypothetical protein